MPRQLRQEVEGGVFHVFARGNAKEDIYRDDVDRRIYLRLLEEVVGRMGWRLLAFCLMRNHVHLLVVTPKPNLGGGMQRLHGEYARTFNKRHSRCGHLFQGRYGAVRVTSDPQLWAVARYIARNPVEAGLSERLEGWPWSSHTALVARRPPSWLDGDDLLARFGAMGGDPVTRYREFVEEGW